MDSNGELYVLSSSTSLSHFYAHCAISPTLYFAKVDVKACFDTIEQGKLLEIISTLLTEVTPSVANAYNKLMLMDVFRTVI